MVREERPSKKEELMEKPQVSVQAKNTYNPRSKVTSTAVSNAKPGSTSNNNVKGGSNLGKTGLETIMGQKLSGPKISTIKRWLYCSSWSSYWLKLGKLYHIPRFPPRSILLAYAGGRLFITLSFALCIAYLRILSYFTLVSLFILLSSSISSSFSSSMNCIYFYLSTIFSKIAYFSCSKP